MAWGARRRTQRTSDGERRMTHIDTRGSTNSTRFGRPASKSGRSPDGPPTGEKEVGPHTLRYTVRVFRDTRALRAPPSTKREPPDGKGESSPWKGVSQPVWASQWAGYVATSESRRADGLNVIHHGNPICDLGSRRMAIVRVEGKPVVLSLMGIGSGPLVLHGLLTSKRRGEPKRCWTPMVRRIEDQLESSIFDRYWPTG